MNGDKKDTSKSPVRQAPKGKRRANPHYRALNLLAIRPRSVHEMRERLLGLGTDAALVEAIIQDLLQQKLLDDHAFARALIESAVQSKPVGRRYLSLRLKRYGIERPLAERLLHELLPAEREAALAKLAVEKRLTRFRAANIPKEKWKTRLLSHLLQRGFSPSIAIQAFEGSEF